jgi:ribonuclease P protein component
LRAKLNTRNGHEKNLPTAQYAAQAYPRFQSTYGDKERSQDHQRTPCQRQKKIDRISGFETLKLNREFQSVYRRGRNAHARNIVLFYLPSREVKKVGFTASKKVGNAVMRNRCKRRLRALFAEFAPYLNGGIFVWVAKEPMNQATYETLKRDCRYVLMRTGGMADDQSITS